MVKVRDGFFRQVASLPGSDSYLLKSGGGYIGLHAGRNNEADKVVRTDSSGYIQAGWINTTSGAFTGTPDRIYASNDAYIRYMTPANFFPTLTNSGNNISITIAGQTRTLQVEYATNTGNLVFSSSSDPNTAYKDQYVHWYAPITASSGYAGNSYGFPVSNNANGILWLGTHNGVYGGQLGISSNGNVYYRYISANSFPTTASGGSWKRFAFANEIPTIPTLYTLTFAAGKFTAGTYTPNSAAKTINIPTNTSHLTNDSGFLTSHQSLANYVTLDTAQTISGIKTFSTQQKFTVATGTSPFAVNSTTVVTNLNADMVDGKHNGQLTAIHINPQGAVSSDCATVKDAKAALVTFLDSQTNGIGDNITIGESFIKNWDNDNAAFSPSSVYSMIKISGGYSGSTYGQWLLSSFNLTKVGIVGRTGGTWSSIKWLAFSDEIPTIPTLYKLTFTAGKFAAGEYIPNSAAKTINVPTNTSHLTNDSGFLSSHQALYTLTFAAGKFTAGTYTPNSAAKTINIPTNTSHLTNDSGFLTTHQSLDNYVTLNTAQTISAKKTFSVQQAFTVGTGTSPFTVNSTTAVTNLNADLLDGYHRSNLYESSAAWFTATGKTMSITVEGSSTYFYPVVISVSSDKARPTFISIWKNLGSVTPSITGNHSNGSSSLWLQYEMRATLWDGNGGYCHTLYKNESYAKLIAHAQTDTQSTGSLILYLRGGTCQYNISCTNTFTVNIYYSETNIGTASYPNNVVPKTEVDNGGIFNESFKLYGTATKAVDADTLDGKHASEFLTSHQSLTNYVTLNTAQTITGVKTFSSQPKFTVTTANTAPFTVSSTYVVANLNADMLDGLHSSNFSQTTHNHDGVYAKLATWNNMVHSGNEWTVVSGGFSGTLWLNYRTASGTTDGAITELIIGNGAASYAKVRASGFIKNGGTAAQFLKADGSVDSNVYLTSHQTLYKLTFTAGKFAAGEYMPNNAAKTINIPTNTSHLTNDSGFLTSHQALYTLTFAAGKFTAGTYTPNSAAKTINIPTNTSHLTNDSGFLTSHQSLANYVTLNTAQTITAEKTFSTNTNFNSGVILAASRTRFVDLYSTLNHLPPYSITGLKSFGYPVYTDPEFASGNNSVSVYNNQGNGTVTITRMESTESANSSGYILKITTNGTASPGAGGVYQSITSRANAIFVQIFRAKIPSGYNLAVASNSMGTSYTDQWLTSNAGTDKWEWYARIVHCGSTGTFSSGGHVYLTGSNNTSVTWYIAYFNVIDITKGNYDGLRTRYADVADSASTVTSAPKLTTARTLWSQPFDGTANVSGALYDTGTIRPAATKTYSLGSASLQYNLVYAQWAGSYDGAFEIGGANGYDLSITAGHNVGIGVRSPSYKLHVSGDIYGTGWLRTGLGWYNQTYGGGMYMTDSTYVRTYASKPILTESAAYYALQATGGVYANMFASSQKYILKPAGGTFTTSTSSCTGCITITMPASQGNMMVSMWIDVYIYKTNKSFSVFLGGYTYNNSTWANNPHAMVYGDEHRVRFGYNGSNFVIYIGETDSTWAYPQVSVRDVIMGFGGSTTNMMNAWTISFSTSVSNVTADITNYAYTTKNFNPSNYLSQSTADGRYVLKSGDTMTGQLTVPTLKVNSTSDFGSTMKVHSDIVMDGGAYIGDKIVLQTPQNVPAIMVLNSTTICGNLNADMVDGKHYTDIQNEIAGKYVTLDTTQTITGTKTFTNTVTAKQLTITGTASSNSVITSDASTNMYFTVNGKVITVWDGSGNAIRPGASYNNIFSLGTSSYRWSNLYATTINVTSTTMVSNLNANYLGGYTASGLFTGLSFNNNTLSVTIGGNTKTCTINAATDSDVDIDLSQYAIRYKYLESSTVLRNSYYIIKINSTLSWYLSFTVRAYNSTGVAYEINISGHNNGSSYWSSPSAELISHSSDAQITVLFGYDSANKLWIALPTSAGIGVTICNVVSAYIDVPESLLFTISSGMIIESNVQHRLTVYRPLGVYEIANNSLRWNGFRLAFTSTPGTEADTIYIIT